MSDSDAPNDLGTSGTAYFGTSGTPSQALGISGRPGARPSEGGRAAFVEEAGAIFTRLGHSRTAARVMGVLLIEEDAGASDLAGYLGVAKSSMSVALRRLVEAGLITRFRRSGQRRDRYRLTPEAFIRGARTQVQVFDSFAKTAERGLSVVGDDPVLRPRLEHMRDLHLTLIAEFSRLLDRIQEILRNSEDITTIPDTVDVRATERSALRHGAQRTQPSPGQPQGYSRHRAQGDRAGGQANGRGHRPGVDQGGGNGS